MGMMDKFRGDTDSPRPARIEPVEKPGEDLLTDDESFKAVVDELVGIPIKDPHFKAVLGRATMDHLKAALLRVTDAKADPIPGHRERVKKILSRLRTFTKSKPAVKYPEREESAFCGTVDSEVKSMSRALRDGASNEVYVDAYRMAEEIDGAIREARRALTRAERILAVSKMIGGLTEGQHNEYAGALFDFISAIDKTLPGFDVLVDRFIQNWTKGG